MVGIGIVGLGFMGMVHYLAARRVLGARVTAVCSRDPVKRAGDWRGVRGNFGPPGAVVDLGPAKGYERFEDLLADPAIDLVDICTPAHRHADMVRAALEAGKHVLVEKPIALDLADADAMVATAARYGRLIGAHLQRVISRPNRPADPADPGPAVDLHVHDAHFVGLIAGIPGRVFSSGLTGANGSVEYLTTQYLYGPDGPAVSSVCGAIAARGRPFQHGFTIHLERATLAYDSGGTPLTVFGADGTAERPVIEAGDEIDVFAAEIRAAVEGVRAGLVPRPLNGQLARDALRLCHLECESVASGRIVTVG
jgi:predicted dehydrogenase